MNRKLLWAIAATAAVGATTVGALGAQPGSEPDVNIPAVGPRGSVGPDVPLNDAEQKQFAQRVSVEGRTAADVQAACERAVQEGVRVVFLPAGEYVFETTVRVPGGLTLLGEGSKTLIRTQGRDTHLFHVEGDLVRFTRLKLHGADPTPSENNDTYGISVSGGKNVRIDHCELLGFSYATNFGSEATAQIDHCHIHHNLRDGLGYGVALYSGAYVLVTDNEFSQNRHSLASNGTLDWSSGERLGKYLHKPGRKTHWEFVHNHVGSNDQSVYELCAVDTHPGMDGTFVVEGNLFENLRHGIGIRDGSGLIRANLFRNLRGKPFRPFIALSISYGTHNNIPVEGCMPHDIEVAENTFLNVGSQVFAEGVLKSDSAPPATAAKYVLGQAENVTIEGELLPETQKDRGVPPPLLRLQEMGEDGVLNWREVIVGNGRRVVPVSGTVTDAAKQGQPVAGATVLIGERSATTDEEGRFTFAEVSEAAQFLVVSKAGFETAVLGFTIQPDQPLTLNPRLSPDHTPPVFTDMRADGLTHTSVALAWETDEPTTGEVEYGPITGQGDKETRRPGDGLTTTHRVELADLRPATAYRCRVQATDASRNMATSEELLFRTAPAADPMPPAGWGYYAGAGQGLWGRTAQEAHSGQFSAFLQGVAHEGGSLNVALVVGESDGYSGAKAYPAEPGATYQYSFWAKGDFPEVRLVLMTWSSAAAEAKDREHTALLKFTPTAEWTPQQGEFTMPAQAKKFVLLFQVYAENLGREPLGVLYVDDVEAGPGGTNAVKNGGAENK